ncbi:MAG TPA: hypothetical protein VH352_19590 [Pseudonocardiaceae bacterium]|jgi:hypothetical protein|nr:hypothetical protein [Pseudonocardiaceae bacterium]
MTRRRTLLAILGACLLAGCATQPVIQVAAGSPTASTTPTCPSTLPRTFPDVPGSAMVPGTPTIAAICRYAGTNDTAPDTLSQSATITGDRLRALVTGLNASRPFPSGAYNCPADLGLYDLIVFGYPSAGPVDVRVSVSGCTPVTNGHQTMRLDPDVFTEITTIVGESRH